MTGFLLGSAADGREEGREGGSLVEGPVLQGIPLYGNNIMTRYIPVASRHCDP